MQIKSRKLSFGIIGTGAITELGYLPAFREMPDLEIAWVVDLNKNRALSMAEQYSIPNYTDNYRDLFGKVDAVIVATPPDTHAQITIDCLNSGLHVLCEKPLATSSNEAMRMVEISKQKKKHLAIGMVRREAWSAQLLKKLMEKNFIGEIQGFDIEEGFEFNWPLQTGYMFVERKAGGVITDNGSHLIDLILWLLGSRNASVSKCLDDNYGGVESNAIIELIVHKDSEEIKGKIELSFTRRLRNTIKIYGEKGCLEAETVGSDRVYFYPGNDSTKPIIMTEETFQKRKRHDDFTSQLSKFSHSILSDSIRYAPAEDAVKVLSLIEECYRKRSLITNSWETKHLERYFQVTFDE